MDEQQDLPVEVRRLSEKDFLSLEHGWQDLIGRSEVDPLFLGWAWQYSWWETWSERLGLELVLLAAYADGRLIGLAPLYLDSVPLRRRLKIKRLQFIGNAWRKAETVRTEYLDFICDSAYRISAVSAFFMYIRHQVVWDEFILSDFNRSSSNYSVIKRLVETHNLFCFKRSVDYGNKLNTAGSFFQYLSGLGSNTRLKLYNRRNYLESLGVVKIEYASLDEVPDYFDELNRLHRTRWNKDCFCGPSLEFHRKFLDRIPSESLKFSQIRLDNNVLSVLYNVHIYDCEYNIQAGYLEDFDKKLSLGTLHLGYAIEQAFNSERIHRLDLLAGGGKNTYYKSKIAEERVEFVTLQIARNRLLKWLYKLYLLSPASIRRILPKNLF